MNRIKDLLKEKWVTCRKKLLFASLEEYNPKAM